MVQSVNFGSCASVVTSFGQALQDLGSVPLEKGDSRMAGLLGCQRPGSKGVITLMRTDLGSINGLEIWSPVSRTAISAPLVQLPDDLGQELALVHGAGLRETARPLNISIAASR